MENALEMQVTQLVKVWNTLGPVFVACGQTLMPRRACSKAAIFVVEVYMLLAIVAGIQFRTQAL